MHELFKYFLWNAVASKYRVRKQLLAKAVELKPIGLRAAPNRLLVPRLLVRVLVNLNGRLYFHLPSWKDVGYFGVTVIGETVFPTFICFVNTKKYRRS